MFCPTASVAVRLNLSYYGPCLGTFPDIPFLAGVWSEDMPLTDRTIKTLKKPGVYRDSRGLYLLVEDSARKGEINRRWFLRYQLNGRRTRMGLGSYPEIGLSMARDLALEARRRVKTGIDPVEEKRAQRITVRLEESKRKTFRQVAEDYIKSKRAEWSNPKHAQQWQNTLSTYAYPVMGSVPVGEIDLPLVLEALNPIWVEKTETATRVRQRIQAVLDSAKAKGYRTGDNPASLKMLQDAGLPKARKIRKVTPHAALPYGRMSEFMGLLRQREGIAAQGLEFLILTASRVGPVIKARWSEIDFNAKIWTCPSENMKRDKEHRVPLSGDALSLLRGMEKIKSSDYVFPAIGSAKGLSNMAMTAVIRRMAGKDWPHFTTHGFRSTFRTWVQERTLHQREVAEAALHHVVGDEVEQAYARGDVLAKRRKLMEDWARFCATPYIEAEGDNVVALHGEQA